jgi:hypothetical protein
VSAIRPGNTGQPPPGTKSQNSPTPPQQPGSVPPGEQGPVPFLQAEKQNPPPKHVRKTLGQPSGIGTREQAKGGPTNPGTHEDPTNSTTASADHPLTTKAGALHAPKAVRPPEEDSARDMARGVGALFTTPPRISPQEHRKPPNVTCRRIRNYRLFRRTAVHKIFGPGRSYAQLSRAQTGNPGRRILHSVLYAVPH